MDGSKINRIPCPNDGIELHHDKRPMTFSLQGKSVTISMPGWYCDACGESLHTGTDMILSDQELDRLKEFLGIGGFKEG